MILPPLKKICNSRLLHTYQGQGEKTNLLLLHCAAVEVDDEEWSLDPTVGCRAIFLPQFFPLGLYYLVFYLIQVTSTHWEG
jgi:hypothetical protein